jgi:hypothetical protein
LDTDLSLSTDLKLSTDLDLSSGMDKGFGDLNLGGDPAPGPIQKDPPTEPAPSPAPGVDRRVGRWTTGARGSGG